MALEQVQDHIRSLSNDALTEYIITGTEVYEPDAIAFAREEFQRRNLDPTHVRQMEAEANAKLDVKAELAAEAAARPLDFDDKLLAFWHGLHGPFALHKLAVQEAAFFKQGEDRKVSEMWRAARYGFATIVLALVVVLFITWLNSKPSH
jgi:hypothetical protein